MAGAGSIPKYMAVVPVVQGASAFVRDATAVRTAVLGMSRDINKAMRDINKSPAATIGAAGDAAAKARAAALSSAPITRVGNAISATNSKITKFNQSLGSGLTRLKKWSSQFNAAVNPMTKFGATLGSLGRGLTRFSSQMDRLGRSMLIGLTLPIAAAGIMMVKAGTDFEASLVKVETLVGVNQAKVAEWGDEILDTAAKLGALPTEMAAGLFAAASGFGSIAAQAPVMDVLVASTQAAAIGLGEIEDIARSATSMMNAFGKENLNASQAVSLLVMGVREGQLEVDKLATAVGNVLGTAAAIGAGADDVIAFISAYTRFGVEPTRAVTSLNTALTNLIKPSKRAREILEAYGLTLDEIKAKIGGPGGLADLLVDMSQSMEEEQFFELFGIRSLRAILAVTDEASEFYVEYLRISSAMTADIEANGAALIESFERVADTLRFKFEVIKAQIQTIFIGANSAIAPILKEYADRLILLLDDINKFVRANQETVKVIIKVALAVALLAPALLLFSKFILAFGLLSTAAGGVLTAVGWVIGTIINLGVHLSVIAITIATRTVMAFLSLASVLLRVAAATVALTAKTLIFLGVNVASGVWGIVSAFVGLGLAIGPVVFVLGAVTTVVLGVLVALSDLGEAIGGVASSAKETFTGMVSDARKWGQGLVQSFSQGIFDGLIYLVEALNTIGKTITYWLRGQSPPRIAPDIDKWGTATMQEWIDGWGKADFGIFTTIQNTIKSFLTSVKGSSGEDADSRGIAGIILGTREFIASAINEMKEFGKVSAASMQKIFTAIGTTTVELENYIDAMIRAGAASQRLADAQKVVNDITARYSAILNPIQRQIDAITRRQSLEIETKKLQKVLSSNAPEDVKKLAALQLQKLQVEFDRDEELDLAQAELDEAQRLNDLAQEDVEIAKLTLGLQTSSFDLLGEMNEKLSTIKGALDSVAKGLEPLGNLGELTGADIPPTDPWGLGDGEGDGGVLGILGAFDEKLLELREKMNETKETWVETWKEIKYQANLAKWNLIVSFGRMKRDFFDQWGPTITALKTEWDSTWLEIKGIFRGFWVEIKPTREAFMQWLSDLGGETATNAPAAITAIGNAVRDDLLPHLESALGFMAGTVLSVEWWETVGQSINTGVTTVTTQTDELAVALQELSDTLTTSLQGLSDGITTPLQEFSDKLTTFLNDLDVAINDFFRRMDLLLGFNQPDDSGARGEPGELSVFDKLKIAYNNFDTWATETFGSVEDDPIALLVKGWVNSISDAFYGEPEESYTDLAILAAIRTDKDNFIEEIGGMGEEIRSALANLDLGFSALFVGSGESPPTTNKYGGTRRGRGRSSRRAPADAGVSGFSVIENEAIAARVSIDELVPVVNNFGSITVLLLNANLEISRLKYQDWITEIDTANDSTSTLSDTINDPFIIALDNLYALLADSVIVALEGTHTWLDDIWTLIDESVVAAIGSLKEALVELKTEAIDPMNAALEKMIELLKEAWEWVQKVTNANVNIPDIETSAISTGQNGIGAPVNAPVIVSAPGTAGSSGGSGGAPVMTFGDVTINNDMDMATFEAKVRNAVAQSMMA